MTESEVRKLVEGMGLKVEEIHPVEEMEGCWEVVVPEGVIFVDEDGETNWEVTKEGDTWIS